MRKLRLCIGSNEGEKTADCHLGDSEHFHIYDLFDDSRYRFIEKRANSVKDEGHARESKMKEILKVLNDVDVLISRKKSPNFVRIAANTKFQPVIVRSERIEDSILELGSSFDMVYDAVEKRKKGERPEVIEL